MSSITSSSLAAGLGVGVKNKVFKASAAVLDRKIFVLGTPLAANVDSVTLAVPKLITCPEDGSDKYGAGSCLARLIAGAFKGSNYSVPVYAFPEAEPDDAVAATGALALVVTTVKAGTLYLYVAGTLYEIEITAGETATQIGDAIVSALPDDDDCPVTAANAAGTVTLTAKSKGVYGNDIDITINAWPQDGEELPSGLTVTITKMSGGSGVPDLATDLSTGLGSGDSANESFFTDVVHPYGQKTAILDAISAYVGEGNGYTGLYDRLVHRPFRCLTGDVSEGSDGLAALVTLGDSRKSDRANGAVARPGSMTHPSEIAAVAIGVMARINNTRAEENYVNVELPGVDPGNLCRLSGEDWTMSYTNRDTAVKAGISPTIVEDGAVLLQNVVTFYHPSSIPTTSNAFREMRNISVLQNILYNRWKAYKAEKWQGFTIVSDTKNVTNATSREKARDKESVRDEELALIHSFAAHAWIYDPDYSIDALKDAVTVREGGDGFEIAVPYILSGVGNIIDSITYVDTSIAVLSSN